MKKIALSTLIALTMVLPASGQSVPTALPTLTWPDDTVTTSTKGCAPAAQTVCTLSE